MVPPISIQPLVEKAIHQGIRKRKGGAGTVKIHILADNKYHIVKIINDDTGFVSNEIRADQHTHTE